MLFKKKKTFLKYKKTRRTLELTSVLQFMSIASSPSCTSGKNRLFRYSMEHKESGFLTFKRTFGPVNAASITHSFAHFNFFIYCY
jgi:hypothetical protein